MRIDFCRHAKRQMKWRKIREDEVRDVINNPEKIENARKGKKIAFKVIKGRLLKITYKEENQVTTIITAIAKG